MATVNGNFMKLQSNYLFADVTNRVKAFQAANPSADVIKLGIGDVTQPLSPAVTRAMHTAVDAMGEARSFRGYGPYEGYDFLRDLIVHNDYAALGVSIDASEIFVSDGAKSDTANIQELFADDSIIAVTDPVYPVYVDSNVMAGRTGRALDGGRYEGMVYLPCTAANGFVPELPTERADIIYLCYPNNPTGAVATREQLGMWVDYARETKAVIIYDAAYEAYITEPGIPRSIYEIAGADEVAMECRSFSKTAGFTGTRCGFTVIPHALKVSGQDGTDVSLNPIWMRRQSTKYNGTPYVVQAAAAAVYSDEGKRQTADTIGYYMNNARIILDGIASIGLDAYGGVNAPYIWLKTPGGMTSWAFFDKLLSEAHVVGTPGSGFGSAGEGYFRLTAFGDRSCTEDAMERLRKLSL